MASSPVRDLASTILKIGGVLLIVLGIADILKGLLTIVVISFIGGTADSYLASLFPALGFVSWLLPLLGPIIRGASSIIGAVAAIISYQLMKLSTPIPVPERERCLIITAVLAAIALAFSSPWYLPAFALIMIGLPLA